MVKTSLTQPQASVKAKDKMSVQPPQQNEQVQAEQKPNDKEYNFAQIRKQLEQERAEKQQLNARLEKLEKEREQVKPTEDAEDFSNEPYVDERRLNKKLAKLEERFDKKVEEKAEAKARSMMEQDKQAAFLKSNPDFNEILSEPMLQKFVEKHPEIAEPMLEMPASFARQKLLYQNIKALGLNRKEEAKPSVQEIIDKNRRNAYYVPSGVGTAPYGIAVSGGKDYSDADQKAAYDWMKATQKRLRI